MQKSMLLCSFVFPTYHVSICHLSCSCWPCLLLFPVCHFVWGFLLFPSFLSRLFLTVFFFETFLIFFTPKLGFAFIFFAGRDFHFDRTSAEFYFVSCSSLLPLTFGEKNGVSVVVHTCSRIFYPMSLS